MLELYQSYDANHRIIHEIYLVTTLLWLNFRYLVFMYEWKSRLKFPYEEARLEDILAREVEEMSYES